MLADRETAFYQTQPGCTCQIAGLNIKSLRDSTVFRESTLFSLFMRRLIVFFCLNEYETSLLTIMFVCAKSEPVCQFSLNVVAVVNGHICELRMTSRCIRTASFRGASFHFMTNLMGHHLKFHSTKHDTIKY